MAITLDEANKMVAGAIAKAKELAGIDAETAPRLIYYPHRKSGFEALESLFGAERKRAKNALFAAFPIWAPPAIQDAERKIRASLPLAVRNYQGPLDLADLEVKEVGIIEKLLAEPEVLAQTTGDYLQVLGQIVTLVLRAELAVAPPLGDVVHLTQGR